MRNIFFSSLLIVLFFSGCYNILERPMLNLTTQTNFDKISYNMVTQICKNIVQEDLGKDFYVVDFVNIENLENKSQLGFILSNHLKSNFFKVCSDLTIKEIELGKNIKLGRNGSKILTRELDELKSKVVEENSNIVIGTYAITTDRLMIFLKVIDLETGIIKSSTSTATPLTTEILGLEGYETSIESSNTNAGPRPYRPLVL
ncbi:MAG: FlgO family outer membrane protein [Arcobacteraceae bacterium]|nr:FlgO family outer membrane protein [Arcobacteraceae bacterium]